MYGMYMVCITVHHMGADVTCDLLQNLSFKLIFFSVNQNGHMCAFLYVQYFLILCKTDITILSIFIRHASIFKNGISLTTRSHKTLTYLMQYSIYLFV